MMSSAIAVATSATIGRLSISTIKDFSSGFQHNFQVIDFTHWPSVLDASPRFIGQKAGIRVEVTENCIILDYYSRSSAWWADLLIPFCKDTVRITVMPITLAFKNKPQ